MKSARPVAAFIGVLFIAISTGAAAEDPQEQLLQPGSPAPTFSLPTLVGDRVGLRLYCGDTLLKPHINNVRHIMILSFWATYCKPCQKEIPELMEIATKYASDSVKILLINIDKEGASLVAPFVKEKGYTLPVLLDPYRKTAERYGVRSLPALFIVDPLGTIRYSSIGYDEKEPFKEKIEKIISDIRANRAVSVESSASAGEAVSIDEIAKTAAAEVPSVPVLKPEPISAKARWAAVTKVECGTAIQVVADSLNVKPDEIRKWYADIKKAALALWGE